MTEKKKFKFTFIDLLVLIVVVAVAVFVGSKLLGFSGGTGNAGETKTFIVSYFFEEVPDYVADVTEVGTLVTDEARKIPLGKVLDVEVGDSYSYSTDKDGNWKVGPRAGFKSVKLSVEVVGEEFEHGVQVQDGKYVVGHSMTIYAGKAKMYGRVSGVEEKK